MNRFLLRKTGLGKQLLAGFVSLCLFTGAAEGAGVQPSTFDSVIGHALLCLDALEPVYFYQYLIDHFGMPYQHQGGAWWFHTPNTQLWGVPVSQVLVSDGHGSLLFIAALADVAPEKLAEAITSNAGIRFQTGAGAYPQRESVTGSIIVYSQLNAKLYCALSPYFFRLSAY